MRSRIGAVSVGVLFGLTVLGALGGASRTDRRFKGPGLILAYGGPLRHRVVLADMRENTTLLQSVRAAMPAERIVDTTAEHVELVLFWGPGWAGRAKDSAAIERLPTSSAFDQSIQKGRYYLRAGRRAGVIELQGRPESVVLAEAESLLARHGVPTRVGIRSR